MEKYTKIVLMAAILFGSSMAALQTTMVKQVVARTAGACAAWGKKRVVFFVDLDDVVVSVTRLAQLKAMVPYIPGMLSCLTPTTIKSARRHVKENGWAAEGWYEWSRVNGLGLHTMIEAIQDSKTIIQGTRFIIQQLKEEGHTVVVLSNMGTREFTRKSQAGGIFEGLFETTGNTTVDYSQKPVIKKPNPLIYEQALAQLDVLLPGVAREDICAIFIDDKKKNIDAAEKAGFDWVIQFKKSRQLATDLLQKGFLTNVPLLETRAQCWK